MLSVRSSAPKAQVSLLASRAAIMPSKPLELGIRFEMAEGWHTYWRNHGPGAGMAPSFKWQLPEGFELGPVRFPSPEYYVDAAGDASFILSGEAVLLAELRPPAGLKTGENVTIGLEARWLVCKDVCAMESKSLSLTLPVVAEESTAQLSEADLFEHARRQLPLPMAKAKYLRKLWAAASVEKVKPTGKFQIAVVLDIQDKHHINSHQPLSEELIPTRVFPDTVSGAFLEAPIFPNAKLEETSLGKLSVYTGRAVIVIPVEADGELPGQTLRFSGVVSYQACSEETGTCFPPTAVEWELILPMAKADETVSGTHGDLFAGLTAASASGPAGGGFDLDAPITSSVQSEQHSLAGWLLFAFLAGLLLNITPCVLPVISIKILSFVQEASASPGRVFKLGLAFSFGMLLVFNVLAILATAAGLAWGQHFQSPIFTIAMASIVFAFSLSLFGVFTVGVPQSVGDLSVKTEGEGYLGSVAKGAFATIMGTPCVGPFLGPVLVWAAAQPVGIVFLVFNTIGLGMTLPYALLAANPKWLRFVPRPGPWLTIFKQAMAFVLLAIVVKLLGVTEAQLGGGALVSTLLFFTALGVGCWILGTWLTPLASSRQRWISVAAALAVVLGTGWYSLRDITRAGTQAVQPITAVGEGGAGVHLPWVPFSLAKLSELTGQGKTVLLDITAAWCSNCHANSKFVFNTPEMLAVVEKQGIVPILADWSNNDPEIGKLISKLAPGGSVPLCAIFPAGRPNEPIVMLGLVTQRQVIEAIEKSTAVP